MGFIFICLFYFGVRNFTNLSTSLYQNQSPLESISSANILFIVLGVQWYSNAMVFIASFTTSLDALVHLT